MQLVQTSILNDLVHLRYETADGTEWIDLRVKAERTGEHERLALIRREALHRAEEIIDNEIHRLRLVEGRKP